jgi:AraC-like DNA-binding protein
MREANPAPGQEQALLWRDAALHGIEMLRATYTRFAFAPHTHDTYAIGVTERGAQTFTSRRHRELAMPAGTIAVVHPGEVHASRAFDSRGWSYRMLYPGVDLIQRICEDALGRRDAEPFFTSPVIVDPELAVRVRGLLVACERPETCALERESRLRSCLCDLVCRHAPRAHEPRLVRVAPAQLRPVRELLESCPERVSLQQLAERASLSRYQLLRAFRDVYGLPPHAYLIQVRVRRASASLRSGASIADAALAAGFADQSHLTRCFKRATGVTPGQYVKASVAC